LVSASSAPCLQILEIFQVIGAKPHHHDKVADHGGALSPLSGIPSNTSDQDRNENNCIRAESAQQSARSAMNPSQVTQKWI